MSPAKKAKPMIDRMRSAIRATYEVIASDLAALAEGEMTIDDAIECTLDADRVTSYGRDDEAALALYAKTYAEMKPIAKSALKEYF